MYLTIFSSIFSETAWPNGPGHMNKMAAMPIYGKNLQKSFFTELSLMIMKLGLEQYVLKLYKSYINDDPEFILTHLRNVKFGETFCCTYNRPRYQVSVYRTIGPLVSLLETVQKC